MKRIVSKTAKLLEVCNCSYAMRQLEEEFRLESQDKNYLEEDAWLEHSDQNSLDIELYRWFFSDDGDYR